MWGSSILAESRDSFVPDPFAPSTDPDIPTPKREDLLRLAHANERQLLQIGDVPSKVTDPLWAALRRQWDEGHKRDAERKRANDKPSGRSWMAAHDHAYYRVGCYRCNYRVGNCGAFGADRNALLP